MLRPSWQKSSLLGLIQSLAEVLSLYGLFSLVLCLSVIASYSVASSLGQSELQALALRIWPFSLFNLVYVGPVILAALAGLLVVYGALGLFSASENRRSTRESRLLQQLESPEGDRRRQAIAECGSRRLLQAEGRLVHILLSDPVLDLRRQAYDTLGLLGRPQLDHLASALAEEQDLSSRLATIALLGKIQDERRLGVLKDVYREDPDPRLRGAVLDAIDRLSPGKRADVLCTLLKLPAEKFLRLKILRMLDRPDQLSSPEPLLDLLQAEGDREVRLQIFTVIRGIRDVRCTRALTEALRDSDKEIRDLAAEALKSAGIHLQATGILRKP